MSEVKLEKHDSVDKALRKLKKKLDREGTLKQLRERRVYEKPSTAKYKKRKRALWAAKIQAREDSRWR